MLKKLGEKYHSSDFKKSILAIKNRPLLLLYIILLDVSFFAVFYLLNIVLNMFLPDNPEIASVASNQMTFFMIMLLLSILYFVTIILAYSFFNLIILGNIKKMTSSYKHNFSLFKNMFLLNLLLFIFFFIILALFNMLIKLSINKPIWIASLVFGLIFIILVFAYAFYNFSHSLFILRHKLLDTIKKSYKYTFSHSYLGILLFSIIFMAIYFGIYLIAGLFIKNFIFSNYTKFINASSIVTIIIAYVLFTFNRIYFFFITQKITKKNM